jgi:ABC-type multidrug transport system fused ATPase/permease subunit
VADAMPGILASMFWNLAHSIANINLFFFFIAKESLPIAFLNLGIMTVFIILSLYLSKKMIPIVEDLNKKRASLSGSYVDFMTNILTVKKLGLYNFAESKLNNKTKLNYRQIQKLQNFHSNRWFLLHLLFGLAFLSTMGYLLFNISTGKTSFSLLILFVAAYAFIRRNIEVLSEQFRLFMELKAYINNLNHIVEQKTGDSNKITIENWNNLKFKNISFKYGKDEKKIFIPSFTLKKGEKVCIVGKSGQGKTTFLNICANFLKPQSGKRLIDNNDYLKINNNFFYNNIALISQEVELFNISLKENITLGTKISDEKIKNILKQLDLYTWVRNLPDGLNTIVGEKGVKLSAGQKQRINLVRGILLNRNIYLLDEPTSNLDTSTENKVISFLEKELKNKTAIIVSHRESLKTICNKCYKIENKVFKEIK